MQQDSRDTLLNELQRALPSSGAVTNWLFITYIINNFTGIKVAVWTIFYSIMTNTNWTQNTNARIKEKWIFCETHSVQSWASCGPGARPFQTLSFVTLAVLHTNRLVVNQETFNNFILCVYMTFTGQVYDSINSMIRLQTAEKTPDSCGVYRD